MLHFGQTTYPPLKLFFLPLPPPFPLYINEKRNLRCKPGTNLLIETWAKQASANKKNRTFRIDLSILSFIYQIFWEASENRVSENSAIENRAGDFGEAGKFRAKCNFHGFCWLWLQNRKGDFEEAGKCCAKYNAGLFSPWQIKAEIIKIDSKTGKSPRGLCKY